MTMELWLWIRFGHKHNHEEGQRSEQLSAQEEESMAMISVVCERSDGLECAVKYPTFSLPICQITKDGLSEQSDNGQNHVNRAQND